MKTHKDIYYYSCCNVRWEKNDDEIHGYPFLSFCPKCNSKVKPGKIRRFFIN